MVWNAKSIENEVLKGTFAFDVPKGFKKLDELMPGDAKRNEPTALKHCSVNHACVLHDDAR